MSNVRVRTATIADARGIAEVHVRGWQQAYRGVMPDEFLDTLDVDRRAATRAAMLRDPLPGSFTFVAERAERAEPPGEVIGFVMGYPFRRDAEDPPAPGGEGEAGEIAAIYVLADHYDTGAGRALMEAALGRLAANGHAHAALWVLDGNARARRFYERGGWVPDGVSKQAEFGGATVTEVRYVRKTRSAPSQGPE